MHITCIAYLNKREVYYYSHVSDKKIEAQELSDFSTVTQLVFFWSSLYFQCQVRCVAHNGA